MWSDQGKVAPTQVGATLNEHENGPAAGQLSGRVCGGARRSTAPRGSAVLRYDGSLSFAWRSRTKAALLVESCRRRRCNR